MPTLPRFSRSAAPRACLLALLFSCFALPAAAQVERCVSTVTQFNAAWAQARTENVDILMTVGNWNLAGSAVDPDSPAFLDVSSQVRVYGGYASGCTSRGDDPEATVLTGSRLRFGNVTDVSAIAFERLSFRNLQKLEIYSEQNLSLNRMRFDQVGHVLVHGNITLVRNSLITRSGTGVPPEPTLCAFEVDTFNLFSARFEHNTFADNTGRGALCLQRADAPETDNWFLTLQNNVVSGEPNAYIVLLKRDSAPSIELRNYHTLTSSGFIINRPRTGPTESNITAAAQFVDAATGDYRLASTSPGINSGRLDSFLVNDRDFRGQPRWSGPAPDRGAFESGIGAGGSVITVTNGNDSGAGSLRQALVAANASPDFNRIRFNIPGACPRVITLNSLLPTISGAVAIEGYTQPGSSRNTAVVGNNANICVVINGANQLTGSYGLNVATNAAPDATASIEGLGFSGHSIAAVQFAGGRDHRLAGVQIGGTFGSYTALPSGTGVRIGGATEGVNIGGPEPGDRNVIVHALGNGIGIGGSGSTHPFDAVVENNYIGTLTGGDLRGNDVGIQITGGSGHAIRKNVVSNNASHGIDLGGSNAVGNRILDNRIGIPALCVGTCANRGNGGHGIRIANGADGQRVEGNRIAFNGLDGVAVINANLNTLLRNRFHDNAGIGIDLGDNGRDLVNGNNTLPPANGANGNQNNPTITNAVGTSGQGTATGTLTSRNGWYRIDFHAAPQCTLVFAGAQPQGFWGQGEDWLGSSFVQISNGSGSSDGSATFQGSITGLSSTWFDTQRQIMATATRLSGAPNNPLVPPRNLGTSEFGRCRLYQVSDVIFANGFESP